MAITAAEATGV